MSITGIIVQIIVGVIIVAPILWLSGRALVGSHKAKFSHAVWIVVLGVIIGAIVEAVLSSILLSGLIMFIVWLWLIKHFFDCGWLRALAIAIVAVIIFIIIAAILVVLGIGIAALPGL